MKGKKTNIQNAPFKAAKAIIKKQWLNGNQKQDSWYKKMKEKGANVIISLVVLK